MKEARAARKAKPKLKTTGEDEELEEEFDDSDALIMAAMQGNTAAVGVLIDSGVSVDHKDAIGVAPLHWAAFCGHAQVTQRLLDSKADIHVQDREGRTPLHVAAYENQQECIKVLIRGKASLHSPDKAGWTPLHCAVSNAVEGACRLLTEAGADPLSVDFEGKSALDLARHFGNTSVLAVLEGAHEASELLALKDLGIGSHRHHKADALPSHRDPSISPNSVSSPLRD